jgi:hypothetical protein
MTFSQRDLQYLIKKAMSLKPIASYLKSSPLERI